MTLMNLSRMNLSHTSLSCIHTVRQQVVLDADGAGPSLAETIHHIRATIASV